MMKNESTTIPFLCWPVCARCILQYRSDIMNWPNGAIWHQFVLWYFKSGNNLHAFAAINSIRFGASPLSVSARLFIYLFIRLRTTTRQFLVFYFTYIDLIASTVSACGTRLNWFINFIFDIFLRALFFVLIGICSISFFCCIFFVYFHSDSLFILSRINFFPSIENKT